MRSARWLVVPLLALTLTSVTAETSTAAATPSRSTRLSDAKARAMLSAAGISVYSSGRCSNRLAANCTSLDTIRAGAVLDAILLKKASHCSVLITAGTETGHAAGPYSHWNGYKVDINRSTCLAKWIPRHYRKIATNKHQNYNTVFWLEGSHWDVTAKK